MISDSCLQTYQFIIRCIRYLVSDVFSLGPTKIWTAFSAIISHYIIINTWLFFLYQKNWLTIEARRGVSQWWLVTTRNDLFYLHISPLYFTASQSNFTPKSRSGLGAARRCPLTSKFEPEKCWQVHNKKIFFEQAIDLNSIFWEKRGGWAWLIKIKNANMALRFALQ